MERQLQERLIGAAVLFVIAVIMVPAMFSGAPSHEAALPQDALAPGQLKTYEIDLQASSVAGSDEVAKIESPAAEPRDEITAPITDERADKTELASVPASAASSSSAVSASAVTKAVAPETIKLAQAKPDMAGDKAAGAGRFAVQVGSFGAQDKATQIAARIKSLGLSASVTPIKAGGKTLYRVRTGGFSERAAAETALKKIRSSYPEASIVPLG